MFILTFILLLVYALLLLYYFLSWKSITEFKNGGLNLSHPVFITVIIPARNESLSIKKCLDSITAQSYPSQFFEVLVIDDHSSDDTASIVQSYSASNIRLISLKDYTGNERLNSYKKKAIEIGASLSVGKLIITTDADCYAGPDWLKSFASFYEKYQPAFIAAPVNINYNNRFIEIFQALDFMVLQGITGASVHKKLHCMCNGANMAYEPSAFYEVNGFEGIDDIASGDDMLLMHKIYKRYPERVLFLKSRDAIVTTRAVATIPEFLNQRIRWASKAGKYKDKSIMPVLFLVYLVNVLMLIIPMTDLFSNVQYSIFNIQYTIFEMWITFLCLKIFIELVFLYPVSKFFGKQVLLCWFPFMQPLHIIYTVIAGWLGKFGSYRWKGRKVR